MKISMLFLCLASTVLFASCGNDSQGTYYPERDEMLGNLESKSYQVSVGTVNEDNYSGKYLTAEKENEYIEFYWLDNESDLNVIADELENRHSDYEKLVSAEDDSDYGSFIFCATETAFEDSGIVIVDVKID